MKNRSIAAIAILIILTLLVPSAMATNWYVDATAADETLCTAAHPCLSINTAYDLASSGDTINIAAGRYIGGKNVSVTIAKDVTLTGADADTTIIDGFNQNRIFYISSGTVSINDLTIMNGSASGDGGGVYQYSGNLTIANSIIVNNTATANGGGIVVGGAWRKSNVTITNTNISFNRANGGDGGGIFQGYSNEVYSFDSNYRQLTITGSNITHNAASSRGGGILSFGYMKITDSTISYNSANNGNGGGMWLGCSWITSRSPFHEVYLIDNSNISYNTATANGGGIYHYRTQIRMEMSNSTILSNSASSGGGIYLDSPSVNQIWNNIFKNDDNCVVVSPYSHFTSTFSSYLPKTNIIGGPQIRGNYWSNALGDGCGTTTPVCSVNCADKGGDGFCDDIIDSIDIATGNGPSQLTMPVANMTTNASNWYGSAYGSSPLAIKFTSNSLSNQYGAISSYKWDFGDGTTDTVNYPVVEHTYNNRGAYTASLNVTSGHGGFSRKTFYITVTSGKTPEFDTYFVNSTGGLSNTTSPNGLAPLTVIFNHTPSINPDSRQWSFPGGVPSSSTLQNNTVIYNNPGIYNASLTATWGATTATAFKSVSVFKNSPEDQDKINIGDIATGNQTTVTDSTSGVVIKITPSKSSTGHTLTVSTFNESAPPVTFAQTVPLVGEKVYDFASSISNGDIESVNITIPYTDAELAAAGLNVNTLSVYYYNENTGVWEKLTTGGIDTTLKLVWGTTSHLSIYGISGSSSSSSSGTNSGLDSSSDSYDPTSFASTAGATKTEIVNVGGGSAVTRAEMTGTGLGKNLVITSMLRSNLPTTMAAPPTTVYQYMSITSSTITGVVSETSLEFNVPESWLSEHGYTVNDIVMMRNVDGQWQTLNTQLVSQKAGTVFYRATTPGFSYFAIAYQKGGTTIGTGTPVPTKLAVVAASLTNIPAPVYSKSPVAIGPTDTQTVPSGPVTSPVGGMPLTTIIVGVVGAIVIIIGVFFVRRWWIRRQNPALFRKYD